jgi:hypothetical protein
MVGMKSERSVSRRGIADRPGSEKADLETRTGRESERDPARVRADARALAQKSARIDRNSHQTSKVSDV